MTEQAKTKRRAKIAEASQSTKVQRELTYWLTRDMDTSGKLDDSVDVWLSRPSLKPLPGGIGVVWICDDVTVASAEGDLPARFAQWTTDQCLKTCRVYPETERECIRVGGLERHTRSL